MAQASNSYVGLANNEHAWEDIGCKNGTSHSSLDGLNYTHYCAFDLKEPFLSIQIASTFQRCINSCTAHSPACFGVVWDSINHNCYPRSNSKSTASLVSSNVPASLNTALVDAEQYDQAATELMCPYPNLSIQRSLTGLKFRIMCGGSYTGYERYQLRATHVESMEQCLEYCAQSHPLCTRVVFYANLIGGGWLNCRLIHSYAGGHIVPYTRTMAHSAEVVLSLPQPPNWANGSFHQSSSGIDFMLSRNDFRDLNNTQTPPSEILHVDDIQSCLQSCAERNETCMSAVFDHGLQGGFLNCYLFDDLPPTQAADSDFSFLIVKSAAARYVAPPLIAPENKSWIAGAVIGPVGACVAFALLYWCVIQRPKKKKKSS